MNKIARLLTVVIALQTLILAGQWFGVGYLTSARGQVTDPGRDRQQLLDEARRTNDRLDHMIEILRSGDVQVRVIQPDDNKARTTAR